MRSLSEIDIVSKRASRAAGFSWGIAEEIGKNIRLLEMFGLPGIKNLNNFLKKKTSNKYKILKLISANNKTTNFEFCPINLGTNFLDQIKTLENLNEIKFDKTAYPLLLLPFVSRASEVIGKRIFLKLDEKEFLLSFNNNIYSNFFRNEMLKFSNKISIKFLENTDSFEQNEWLELYNLSEEIFVEESDSLKKSAAGSILSDND